MAQDIFADIEEVQELLRSHAEVSGDLASALGKARRQLPRRIYKQGMRLANALPMLEHPKLRQTQDEKSLQQAAREVRNHLKKIDTADRRKGRMLEILGSMAFAILVVFVLLVTVLRWRGFI
ncbi:hypothetical protein [Pseudophaeobacter sp.]|jgi:phosphoribosylformylglycinamidine (FGAM) synthase-like enzyme|uniref:Uncharacterized protein n=1 Tax=Pseudophaeobacter arcticus TaxID=385492 RepID=A0ABQ0AIF2_9RHOB|nr:hypothetical protein [uncultured Pseudophaeobacter sp.]UWS78537.1 hypothetical protein N1037_14810 [Phaeobacter sp. G2]